MKITPLEEQISRRIPHKNVMPTAWAISNAISKSRDDCYRVWQSSQLARYINFFKATLKTDQA